MKELFRVGGFVLMLGWSGCGGRMPEGLGVDHDRLAPCPNKPNCVSSFATDPAHRIDPLAIRGRPDVAWAALRALLDGDPRVESVDADGNYIHAVFVTPLMRYRDDAEFLLQPDGGQIAVRSASRVGYGDMGANRKRIESIRARLAEQGVVEAGATD